ncbi:MAG: DUF4157 domain-containing protein, partial [Xanthobacteraceae bacterium]
MPGRVIQGFFVGGAMRPAPGIVRNPGPPAVIAAPIQRAVAAPAMPRPGPPAPAFAGARTAVQLRPGSGAPARPPGDAGRIEVDPARLGLAHGGGARLPQTVLAKMEAAFGADFSSVRIHVGPQAARIGAVAFTTGNDIY